MNILIVSSIVIAATFLTGAVFAILFARLGQTVVNETARTESEKARYNPNLTMGHNVPFDADLETQLKEARKSAAKRAAALPRGANMGIGTPGKRTKQTTMDGIKTDPVSAVKIAHFHSWQGLLPGAASRPTAVGGAATAVAQTVAPTRSAADLVAGKDYPFIEITEGMSPAEKRKARIANAKAKSAAVKALKEAAVPMQEVVSTAAKTVAEAAQVTEVQVSSTPVRELTPGVDYDVIEITDEMSPDEIRKARIANAKAKSAAMKALKASGQMAAAAPQVAQVAQPAESTQPTETVAPTQIPADIPAPNYIEITDDMDPAEIRSARIQNAKARSTYNKALKAAGIDPSTV